LHHAPLGNIYANTSVCTGTAALPDGVTMKDKIAWESVIFDTAFTHTNHQQTLVEPKRGHHTRTGADADYWCNRKGRNKPFPDRLLCPLGANLGQWITRLKGQGGLA
jgi:PRTRC genetic system protein B